MTLDAAERANSAPSATEAIKSIAAKVEEYGDLAEATAAAVLKLDSILRVFFKKEAVARCTAVFRKIIVGEGGNEGAENDPRAAAARWNLVDALNGAKTPLAYCRIAALAVMVSTAPAEDAVTKELHNNLRTVQTNQIVRRQAEAKENMPAMQKMAPEQYQNFIRQVTLATESIEKELAAGVDVPVSGNKTESMKFDPRSLSVEAARRYLISALVSGDTVVNRYGFYEAEGFEKEFKGALRISEADKINPGIAINEAERAILIAQGSFERFKNTRHFKDYEVAEKAILRTEGFKMLQQALQDKGGGVAINVLINSQATEEQKIIAKEHLRRLHHSVLWQKDPEELGWTQAIHELGEKVSLKDHDPAFGTLNA